MRDTVLEPEAEGFQIAVDGEGVVATSGGDDTLLETLLRAGLGVPYECSAGGCGSCKVTLLEGNLQDELATCPGLRDSDRRKGKRLACVSRPRSDCRVSVRLDPAYEPVIRPRRTTARFLSRRPITHDLTEFRFQSDEPVQFLPGQYAKLLIPGVAGPRNYSMSNTANEQGLWSFVVKRVSGGGASGVLFGDIPDGFTVGIDAPYSIAHLPPHPHRPIICIAGGSGLAPMLSVLRGLGDCPGERPPIVLYYGARSQRDVIDAEHFADIPGFDPDRHYIAVVSEPDAAAPWHGPTGFLHEHLALVLPEACGDFDYYIAGPPPMVDAVRRVLVLDRKVPVERLHYDRFF